LQIYENFEGGLVDTLKKTNSSYRVSTGQNDVRLVDIYKRQVTDKLMTKIRPCLSSEADSRRNTAFWG